MNRITETLKFRMVTHVSSAQSLEVGDQDGHVASLIRFSGVALLADGNVATVYFVTLTDYIHGNGGFTLYPILTFDDGSALHLRSVGTGTVEETKTHFKGETVVVGGKGRFKDAKGSGTLTGTRYTPLSMGADLVSDYIVHLEALSCE